MNWNGILVGAGSFLIIGIVHPVVIQMECHWQKGYPANPLRREYGWHAIAWPVFLVVGTVCNAISLFTGHMVVAIHCH